MHSRRRVLAAVLLLSIPLAFSATPADGENGLGPVSLSAPLPIGEHLVYNIKWDPPWYLFFLPNITAGELDVQLRDDAEFKSRKALKIVLTARSSGTLAKMTGMKIQDIYTYYTEPDALCTMAGSISIREGKRKRQLDIEYLQDIHQLHFRELDEATDPPKIKKDEVKSGLPACVRDPLSALYFYRTFNLKPAHTQTLVIGYNDKVKEVRAYVEKQESLDTSLGKLMTWKIKTESLMGGLFKDGGQFNIWLSADERKIPIQFEAKVKLGRVLGILKSVNKEPLTY